MNAIRFISLLLFVLFIQSQAIGQARNAAYAEILGNGLLFSVNYDLRFSDDTPFGARAGIGYVGSIEDDGGVVTIPIMLNALLGKDGTNFFEVGAGICFLSSDADFSDESVSEIVGTFSLMYRKQPQDGGFMWKIGFAPIIAEGLFLPYWPGLSIGYSW